MRKRKSRGFGDDVAAFTQVTGIKKLVKTVTKAVGIEDCGCEQRQEDLNVIPSITTIFKKQE